MRLSFNILLLCLISSCANQSNQTTLKLAHGLDPSHSVHKAMVILAEELQRESKGKLTIDIYPSQQLGSQRELIELLQVGAVDMTKTSAAVMENFSPLMQVLSMPYLFRDSIHERAVLGGSLGREMLESGIPYNLRGLCYYDAGKRSFYSKEKPILSPEDLKGLKIRVQPSITAIELIQEMGGAATPIAFGELYTALQQGVVDGAENNPPSFYLTRHYEVCKYYVLNEHTAVPDVLLISEHTWKRLDNQERKWLESAVQVSEEAQRKLWKASELEALAAVAKAGVEIIKTDKSLFREEVKGLAKRLLNDSSVMNLYTSIQNVK